MSFRASEGAAQYEDEAYSQLQTIDGPIELYNTQVSRYVMTDQNLAAECSDVGAVNVCGKGWVSESVIRKDSCFHDSVRFYCSQACGNLTVCGAFYAFQSQFEGNVVVNESVTAQGCCFQKCLTAKAEIVDLQCTTAQTIIIEPTGPYYDPQVVRLMEGSVVKGNIYFKSGRGKVCIDNTSSLEGEIFGGHVIEPHFWQLH